MNIEVRKKLAIDEINVVLNKYSFGLKAQMQYAAEGIMPGIVWTDLIEQAKKLIEEKGERVEGTSNNENTKVSKVTKKGSSKKGK